VEWIRKQKTQGATTIVRPLRLHCDHAFTFIQENIDCGHLEDLFPPYPSNNLVDCDGNVREALVRQFQGCQALDLEEPVNIHSRHGVCCVASKNARATDQEGDIHTDGVLVVSAQPRIRFRGIHLAPLRGEHTVATRPIRHSSTSVRTPEHEAGGSIRVRTFLDRKFTLFWWESELFQPSGQILQRIPARRTSSPIIRGPHPSPLQLVLAPSGQLTAITLWDGTVLRICTGDQGVPQFGRREGSWFFFEVSEEAIRKTPEALCGLMRIE